MSEKKTGLGRKAFFQGKEKQEGQQEDKPAKPEKVRTTLTFYPETLIKLEALKLEARKETGRKVTLGEVLAEAIDDLAEKKGVELEE